MDSPIKARLIAAIGAVVFTIAAPLIQRQEGTVYQTYRDTGGILSACRGHTGPELRPGQQFTDAQCDDLQYADMLKHAGDLQCVKVPLNDNQKAAFLSFTYNVGGPKFCGSTLVRKLNAGDYRGACNELLNWTKGQDRNGHLVQLPGLVKRRQEEREICLKEIS